MKKLLEMLEYKRPEGSDTQREFCEKFLEPVFGQPDTHGNYVLEVGDEPTIAFMAHHDTVHKAGGIQNVYSSQLGYITSDADCLGADCTSGVWLILEMIEAGVPGVYCVFAAEEIGCVGSSALVADHPAWLDRVSVAMSFDRYGTTSVITHQMGRRTASDEFAHSVADALNMDLQPDSGGSYTDSNEFKDIIPECTNISVGYYNQHTSREYQDAEHLIRLRNALLASDWSKLVIKRDPDLVEYDDDDDEYWAWAQRWRRAGGDNLSSSDFDDDDDFEDPILALVEQNPEAITKMLRAYSFTYNDILEEVYVYSDEMPVGVRIA